MAASVRTSAVGPSQRSPVRAVEAQLRPMKQEERSLCRARTPQIPCGYDNRCGLSLSENDDRLYPASFGRQSREGNYQGEGEASPRPLALSTQSCSSDIKKRIIPKTVRSGVVALWLSGTKGQIQSMHREEVQGDVGVGRGGSLETQGGNGTPP